MLMVHVLGSHELYPSNNASEHIYKRIQDNRRISNLCFLLGLFIQLTGWHVICQDK
jgi:hypothetical protein